MRWLLSAVIPFRKSKGLACGNAGWYTRRSKKRSWTSSAEDRQADALAALAAEVCARSEGPKETAVAQAKWWRGMIAQAKKHAVSRDGTLCVGELVDRAFKLLGRLG